MLGIADKADHRALLAGWTRRNLTCGVQRLFRFIQCCCGQLRIIRHRLQHLFVELCLQPFPGLLCLRQPRADIDSALSQLI